MLIGLHPGPDFDSYAVAALADISLEVAQQVVDLLARACLIRDPRPGRYGMHDLLRAYAAHLADVEDSEADRRAALTRLFDHYLATAAAAMDILAPAEQHRRPRIDPPITSIPSIPDLATAWAWLNAERANLTAAAAYTAVHGWPDHTTQLSNTLYRYLNFGGHFRDALAIHTYALRSAHLADDSAGEADALLNLGHAYWKQGDYQQAVERLQQALDLTRKIGDRSGEARTLSNLAHVYRSRGHYDQAVDHLQQALTLFREIGDRLGEAYVTNNLGHVYQRQGQYQQAVEHVKQALGFVVKIGDRHLEANALTNLGVVYQQQGHYQQAAERYQQALGIFRETGDQYGETRALNSVGEILVATRQPDRALAHHTAALTLATQISDRYERARAHDGLAHAHQVAGDLNQARHHWQTALALYTDLGVPDADDVRNHLTALEADH